MLKWWRGRSSAAALETEESALRRLQGCSGVVRLLDRVYDRVKGRSVLVLEHIDGEPSWRFAARDLAPARIRHFFHQLLRVDRPAPSTPCIECFVLSHTTTALFCDRPCMSANAITWCITM